MRVLYDIRGSQTLHHPERGIARYVAQHVGALADRPEITHLAGLADSRPLPQTADILTSRGGLHSPGGIGRELPAGGTLIHHVGSLFEMELPFESVLPAALRGRGVITAVTLYDVIPLVYADFHSGPDGRRWRHRASFLRSADLVLSISDYSAHDAVERLGVDPDRVAVIGTGVPAAPRMPRDPAPVALPGLEPGFLLYVGGTEHPRKNVPRLIEAYSRLPDDLRAAHQLVIAGRLTEDEEAKLRGIAASGGVGDRILLPGLVPDDVLRGLYAACSLFVYPSEYEGFGLPIVEAMSYGAPVVASRATSCGELLPDERAGFDPRDVDEIASVVAMGLRDRGFAETVRRRGYEIVRRHTWPEVARRTVGAYAAAIERRRPARPRSRPASVAFISHGPVRAGHVSAAFFAAAAAAAGHADVRWVSPTSVPSGETAFRHVPPRLARLEARRASEGAVVLLDDASDAERVLDLVSRAPATVVAWDLDGALAAPRPGLEAILAAASAIVVATPWDLERLRVAVPAAAARARVIPPPLGWRRPSGAPVDTVAASLGLVGGPDGACRVGGRLSVVAVRPPGHGPFQRVELDRLADLAVRLDAVAPGGGVSIMGPADTWHVADLLRRHGRGAHAVSLEWAPWPGQREALTILAGASCVVDTAGAGPTATRVVADMAEWAGGPPLVSVGTGLEDAAGLTRLPVWATNDELVDAVRSAAERGWRPRPPANRRRPGVVAAALLGIPPA